MPPGDLLEMKPMLSLCLLAFAVTVATFATPVAVPIMWRHIEGKR
jgi:hypothetical protein